VVQSRRDQVHSYQFFLHRVISGLVARESDPAELPFRRLGGATLASVMVTVIALAAVGIYGLIVGGGATSWRSGNVVVVEKETATPFVYRDGRLYPTGTVVSARLVLERYAPVKQVSAKSLAGVPRGPHIGIVGAPAGLPATGRLLTGGWGLCSRTVADGRGGRMAVSLLSVGRPPSGSELDVGTAVLVRDTGSRSDLHLLWNNYRFPLRGTAVLLALGVGADRAVDVAPEWLDALPAGEPIGPLAVEGRGGPTSAFGEPRPQPPVLVGQVIEGPANSFHLVHADRLQPITPLQKDIVLADPATAAAYPGAEPQAREISTGVLANAQRRTGRDRTPAAPPDTRPRILTLTPADQRDDAMCASFAPGRFTPTVLAGARLPETGALATGVQSGDGGLLADLVTIEPGRAALVEAMSSPDAPSGTVHLVTDQGLRFGLASREVAGMLGYRPTQLVRLPASLLDRLPAGPALDPAAAKRPVAHVNPVQSPSGGR
jgi:type VII secretion protein EccB